MWQAFTVALVSFFTAFTKIGSAVGKFAGAVDNLAGVAEATTETFADEAAFKRRKQLATLNHEMQQYEKTLAQDTSAPKLISAPTSNQEQEQPISA